MSIQAIANTLITLSEDQRFTEVRKTYYTDQTISKESDGRIYKGLNKLNKKENDWRSTIQNIYDLKFEELSFYGNFFSAVITWDIQYHGQERSNWKELAVFEVSNEKIISENFYY